MRQLKTIGVRLAIDDFGTRYTGFNLLKRLPLDAMKIDRCFIRGIHQSDDMRTSVQHHHRHGPPYETAHRGGRHRGAGRDWT